MANFDPRMYHEIQAAAMHHQNMMGAARYAAAGPSVGFPHHQTHHQHHGQRSGNGASSSLASTSGVGGSQSRGQAGLSPNDQEANHKTATQRPIMPTTPASVSNYSGNTIPAPGWPRNYRVAQSISFPDPGLACGSLVGELVKDLAGGVGCSVEQVFVPLLACVGGLMGTNTSIRVHRAWSEPPVIWAIVGARAGNRRSAVVRMLLTPILALQAERNKQAASGHHKTDQHTGDVDGNRTSMAIDEDGDAEKNNGENTPSTKRKHCDNTVGHTPAKRKYSHALYSGTRISLAALTEVIHRNYGHAFSLTENIEQLHEMLGISQLIADGAGVSPVASVGASPSRLVSVMEDLYEGLPLVAVEEGRVTTMHASSFCYGGFSSPDYVVSLMMKSPSWLSSRLLLSCPPDDNIKMTFGHVKDDSSLPELSQLYSILLEKHSHVTRTYSFNKQAITELNTFYTDECAAVFNQLNENEHEGIIIKSMGQIVRLCGILKALENSIVSATNNRTTIEWDWTIGSETVKNGVALGKYFLEQKLAMTFMVPTGFFNNKIGNSHNSMHEDSSKANNMLMNTNSRSNDNATHENGNMTTLPHTATPDHIDNIAYVNNTSNFGGNSERTNQSNMGPSYNYPPTSTVHRSNSQLSETSLPQSGSYNPTTALESSFGLPKKLGEVDFTTLPATMTTPEEDVSEMMQAVDFVHFSKTQFVAIHGRRIKRLMECYDDGHGVSATTAAQRSITPPVHIEGTNNRHPAWASALFFQKVAELGLGIAEQSRHPTNKKVCWRFKRKPVDQLVEADMKLLQYLRVEMDKYSQFGSGPMNPTDMVNSGLLTVQPSSSPGPEPLQLAALNYNSDSMDDNSSDSNQNTSNRQAMSIKSEVI